MTSADHFCRGQLGSKLVVFPEIVCKSRHRTAEVVGSNPIISTNGIRGGNPESLPNPLSDSVSEHQTHDTDVLVIGAGGAGLRAAIEASAAGVKVAVICKSLLGKAHTVMAEGGMAAAIANVDDRDSWRVHFADTMRGGQYLNNPRMAELHAQEAPDCVKELEAWGALFDRTKDGKILQRNFGGHKYPRLAHVGDRTGLEMIRTLQEHGIHRGIEFHMECTVVRLLKDGDRVCGAFGYFRERGQFAVFRAKAVVLATGGIGKAYAVTSNSWEYTGDGHALAYHAGADLMDMEFVQFHPTGMVWPPSVRGILVTESSRTARASGSCSKTSPRPTGTKPRRTPRKAGDTSSATRARAVRRSCLLATTLPVASCGK
jgi:succinate dehydrogenase/fumarate reductase flavoprotein subunit